MIIAILGIGFGLAVIDLFTGRRMSGMTGKEMFSVLVVIGIALSFMGS